MQPDPTAVSTPPAVKATIEVPAGQQGQFTISSSSPAPGNPVPQDQPEEPAQEDVAVTDITGKEPVSVVKTDEPSSGGKDNTKTIKI